MRIFKFIDVYLWIPLFISVGLIRKQPFSSGTDLAVSANNFLTNFAYSFVAAFVFYVLIDVIKRMRDTKALGPSIFKQIIRLKQDILSVCKEAARIAGKPIAEDWTFNKCEIDEIFKQVEWFANADMVDRNMNKVTYSVYVQHFANRTRKHLDILLDYSAFLGAEAAKQIVEIQNGPYLNQLEAIKNFNTSNMDCTFLSETLSKHFTAVENLEKWAKRSGY